MVAFLCLCLIGIGGFAVPAKAAMDVWDGTVATGFAGGNGDVNNPYLIATGAQLAFLAQQVEEKVRTERTSGNDMPFPCMICAFVRPEVLAVYHSFMCTKYRSPTCVAPPSFHSRHFEHRTATRSSFMAMEYRS